MLLARQQQQQQQQQQRDRAGGRPTVVLDPRAWRVQVTLRENQYGYLEFTVHFILKTWSKYSGTPRIHVRSDQTTVEEDRAEPVIAIPLGNWEIGQSGFGRCAQIQFRGIQDRAPPVATVPAYADRRPDATAVGR
eukprot:COSAG02_NODE_192_length_29942_cov_34.627228_21_plen_135_part_00